MNRRQTLRVLAAAAAAAAAPAALASGADAPGPIQLHVDLFVDPAREREMLAGYRETFRPTISKQPGFVDVRLLKLRSAIAGKPPAGSAYRLLISFHTEEQRLRWVSTDAHQKAWPAIEKTLTGQKYGALLYDPV